MAEGKSRQARFENALMQNDILTQAECYLDAAIELEQLGDIDSACFNYTHAYVLGLDSGANSTWQKALEALKRHHRE